MSALRNDVDPDGLLEFSVVFSDRSLNSMSAAFGDVMRDISRILKKAYNAACKYFNNILTPDSDRAHHDHFHFDNGLGLKCYFKSIIK